MTETRTQRGHREEGDARQHEQGFEERDAPLRPILIAMGGFGALLAAGLVFPALLLALDGGAPKPDTLRHVQPPPPHLLADPKGQRLRIEAAQQHRLQTGPEPINRAMGDVARRGWSSDE